MVEVVIKTKCVCNCDNELPGTMAYYIENGNYCKPCLAIVSTTLKNKVKRGVSLQQKLINKGYLK